jgi:transcriptional regulator with XRE-family HTH domain
MRKRKKRYCAEIAKNLLNSEVDTVILYPMRTFTQAYKSMTHAEKLEVCETLDVSLATLSRWASGHRTPSIDVAVGIEQVLGISLYSWAKRG